MRVRSSEVVVDDSCGGLMVPPKFRKKIWRKAFGGKCEQAGYLAASAGKKRSECPYKKKRKRKKWLRGYADAVVFGSDCGTKVEIVSMADVG